VTAAKVLFRWTWPKVLALVWIIGTFGLIAFAALPEQARDRAIVLARCDVDQTAVQPFQTTEHIACLLESTALHLAGHDSNSALLGDPSGVGLSLPLLGVAAAWFLLLGGVLLVGTSGPGQTPSPAAPGGPWICNQCRSLNQPGDARCYRCKARRNAPPLV
jgi:hypothetical protein